MNPWTPALREKLVEIIRAYPGIKQVDLAKKLSQCALVFACNCNIGTLVATPKAAETCVPGSQHMLARDWTVSEIYPVLGRLRAHGRIHSVYQQIVVNGQKMHGPNGPHLERKQSWYFGSSVPDMADPIAVQAWLDDVPPEAVSMGSVDDQGLLQPVLDNLRV